MKEFIVKSDGVNYYLVNDGQGGFLNPPGDAEHIMSIQGFRGGKYVESVSLRHVIENKYGDYSSLLRKTAKEALKQGMPECTEEWIQSCYNYFRNCYASVNKDGVPDRKVSNYKIINDGTGNPDLHLAYLHIREFFPDHTPRLDLIANNGPLGSWSTGK